MKPSTIELYESIKARFDEIMTLAHKEGRKVKLKDVYEQVAEDMHIGVDTVRRATA